MRYVYALLLSFTLLSSCYIFTAKEKSPTTPQQILRTSLKMDPISMDPRVGVDTVSDGIIRMLFDGLTYMDQDGSTQLALAESYEISEDQLVYTFRLKETLWSDGSPLTAYDFEGAWKSVVDPKTLAPNANLLYLVKNGRLVKLGELPVDALGVRADDDKTLIVELEHPQASFLDALSNCAFYPLPQKMRVSPLNYEDYVSCGPFQLKKYQLQNKIEIVKNPYYWNSSQVKLDEVHFYIVKDEATALLMFEKGEIDWMGSLLSGFTVDAIPSLKRSGKLTVVPVAGTNWLAFNTVKFPYTNVHIRKALALAINRQLIVDNISHGQYKEALSFVPGVQKKELWHPYFSDNDPEAAKKFFAQGLQELGLTHEQFPVVTLIYNNVDIWHKMMQAVQQQWQEVLGIKVRLESMDGGAYFSRLWKRDFEVARFGWRIQYNDPGNILEVYKYKDFINNHTSWENPQFISCLDQASRSILLKTRWAFLEAAEKILIDEMPAVPLCHNSFMYVQKEYVKGVFVSSIMTADFRWASIERS